MRRRNAILVTAFGAGLAVTFGCTADMRNLNGCRAVTSAVCERNRDCDPRGFDASFADLDACIDSFMSVLGKGSIPTGNDKCGPITTDCLDEIEVAACGRTTMLTKCGIVRSIRPGRSGTSSPGGGGEGGVSTPTDGGAPNLTSGVPDVLEVRQGVLVACKRGEGCRSSTGDTYGGKAAAQLSFAIDSLRNVYGIDAQRQVTRISPSGTTTLVGGPWDVAFSLPMSQGAIGAAFARGADEFFAVGPGEPAGPVSTHVTNATEAIRGLAALPSGIAVYAGGKVSICQSLGCSNGVQIASASGIRGAEGAYAGSRFVAVEQGQAIWSNGFGKTPLPGLADCATAVVAYDDSAACITTSQALRIDDALVPGATDVARIAMDATDVYWVTNAGTYHRASRSTSLLPRDR